MTYERRETSSSSSSSGKEFALWDYKTNSPGGKVSIDRYEVASVAQAFFKNGMGVNVEGCVVTLKDGKRLKVVAVCSEVRRGLEIITPQPAGSPPVRTN